MPTNRIKHLIAVGLVAVLVTLALTACGGGDDDGATAASESETTGDRTTRDELAADNKSCGAFSFYRLAVDEGDISCRRARRVILDLGNNRLPGVWSCTGRDANVMCTKKPGESSGIVITARFASEAAAPDATEAKLSPKQETKQEIERIGDKWAPLFAAAKPTACLWYMNEPTCSRIDCEHVDGRPMKNCTPLSPGLQKSFADATVHDVALRRFESGAIGFKAGAKFSNGETVLFHVDGGGWKIVKVAGNPGRGWRWLGDRLG